MFIHKRFRFLFCVTLVFTLVFGTLAHAASQPDLDTPIGSPEQAEYAILDGLNIGITFGSDGNAYCHANGSAGAATKYVVSGIFQKYASDGHLDLICNWPERTIYGQSFDFYEHALMVTPGEYLFTLYVDVYSGTQCESLVFYKDSTKNTTN